MKRGHQVWIGCKPDSDLYHYAVQHQIPVFPIRIRGDADPIALFSLLRFIRKERIDVLHAQHAKAHAVGLLASVLLPGRFAFFVTRRVSFPPNKHMFSRWKYTSSRIDALIAVSEGVKDVLTHAGVSPDKVRVIYSAVDPQAFQPPAKAFIEKLKQKLEIRPETPVFIKVANYAAWKGQSIFLAAAARLLQMGQRAQFILAGRGNDGEEVSRMINQWGLQKNVVALGFRSDVPDLLTLSNVSVNAAIEGEGLSGALRESLFMGIPVIAADVSGNRELVEEGVTGRLIPPDNPQALADAMGWMLDCKDQAKELAQAGQKRVKSLMLIDQTTCQIESLYREFLPH